MCTATSIIHSVHAQTADALIDKLVEKGILTVNEAGELRKEAKQGATSASSAKSGMPDWVTSVKWGGDLRGRYESFFSDHPAAVDRNRFQYRLRLGMTATFRDQMELGVRIASAGDTPGNPISSNQTLDNNASKKGLAVDLAYGKWSPVINADWGFGLTVGKMENPFVFSPIVFDPDYTPEGLGEQLVHHLADGHDLKLNLGQFVLEERGASSVDSYLIGEQLLWDAQWTEAWQTSLGVAGLAIGGKQNLTPGNGQLNIGEGNSRVDGLASNPPLYNFNPMIVNGGVTYRLESFPLYHGAFPIRVSGEYLNNPGAPANNEGFSAKLTLGKSGKKKLWEAGYEFRELQADAIYEEFPESDFNAFTQIARTTGGTGGFVNGTNVRGHILKGSYSMTDSLTLSVTYWRTENIAENPLSSVSRADRLQVDAAWKY